MNRFPALQRDPALINRSRVRLKRFQPLTRQAEINRLRLTLDSLKSPVLVFQCFAALQQFEQAKTNTATDTGGNGKRILEL